MSLGIGANVLSKHLYITNMEKPPVFNKLNDSSLIQLANRVGREFIQIPYAFVYVNSLDKEHVEQVMNADPSSITAPLRIDQMQKIMKNNCHFSNFLNKFAEVFN